MTQLEISSTILNNITDALSGAINSRALSIAQVNGEVDLLREKLLYDQLRAGKIDIKYFMQNINTIPLVCRDLVRDCGAAKSGESVPSILIPKLISTQDNSQIEYVGLANKQRRFITYYDIDDISNHKFRLKTSHSPFAWVDLIPDEDNNIAIYFFNLGQYATLKFIDIRAAFSKPSELKPLDPSIEEQEYAAPGNIQDLIITTLTERYVRYYRQMNVMNLNNDQQDKII
jgi:hypothetical protein